MASRPNIHEPEWEERDHPGFVARRARLGREAGGRDLGLSLWELPPGEAAYPYHWHLGEEELLVVLEGTPSLRTPGGWEELAEGDVVAFPAGEEGGHQLANRGQGAVRFLAFSNLLTEVVVYPDSGKLGAFGDGPGGANLRHLFRLDDAVDYWEGERPPS